jgi:hypothetical protein
MITQETFEILLEQRIEKIRTMLNKKGAEYAPGEDRLHNFNVAAVMNEESPLKAAWGMATKHIVSIIDIVNSGKIPDPVVAEEKFGDAINYLILMEMIVIDNQGSVLKPDQEQLDKINDVS